MVQPVLASGSPRRLLKSQWQILKELRFANFGATTTILPLIPPEAAINATTHTAWPASSGSSQTATWSAAPSALATPYTEDLITTQSVWTTPGLYGPAGIPAIKFNGSSERLTVPDAAYWTRVAAAFSIVVCLVNSTATGANKYFLSKQGGVGTREWGARVTATTNALALLLWDDSEGVNITRAADGALATNVPVHCVLTKGTTAGGTAMTDAVIYVNGVAVASTANDSGGFINMEDLAQSVSVGDLGNSTAWWDSIIYGGPYGPTFVQAQLTAAQALRDYEMWREAMGLGR